jgi:hypothetical protein
MATKRTRPAFDGGPASEASLRAALVAAVVASGSLQFNGHREFVLTPERIAQRAIEIADACLDKLEIRP